MPDDTQTENAMVPMTPEAQGGVTQQPEEESTSIEQDLHGVYSEADQVQARFMTIAAESEKAGDLRAAALFREVSGSVITILKETIAIVGAGFGELGGDDEDDDEDGGEPESFLLDEDGQRLYATMAALYAFVNEVVEKVPVQDADSKAKLMALRGMITEGVAIVLNSTGYDPLTDKDLPKEALALATLEEPDPDPAPAPPQP